MSDQPADTPKPPGNKGDEPKGLLGKITAGIIALTALVGAVYGLWAAIQQFMPKSETKSSTATVQSSPTASVFKEVATGTPTIATPSTTPTATPTRTPTPTPTPTPTESSTLTPPSPGKVPPTVQALIEQLKDPDADVRHAAATSLGKMGVYAKGAVPALIQRVADDVWGSQDNLVNTDNARGNTSKDAALKALKQLAPDRVGEALLEGMKSTNPLTRKWASAQLGANP